MAKRLWFLLVLLLAACAAQGSDPADMVERYLQAKVDGDAAVVRELLCSAMEIEYDREINSFATVDATLMEMSCQREGDSDIVTCSGYIRILYGTEARDFPLESYRVVQEDGEWRWCGEAGAE